MIDATLVLVIFIVGTVVGIVLWDMALRKQERLDRIKSAETMQDAARKLAETHNHLVTEMKNLGDRVNTHEFVLKSKNKEAEQGLGGKRF